MRKVNAARSPPADVSTIQGMKCSSVAWSKYSRFSPDSFGVAAEVPVAPVVDPLELLPAEREAVLDVDGLLGVVGELVGPVLAEAEALGRRRRSASYQALRRGSQSSKCCGGRLGADEVLHLHLLELAHPEDEVAGADLVAERLADLGDPEGDLLARRVADVPEVDVDALGRLRAQVDDGGLVLDRAQEGLEHQVEAARRAERPAVVRADEARGARRSPGRASSVGPRSSAPGNSSTR